MNSFFSTHFLRRKQAFTLPEVIISISVIVMVITAATSILVSVMRNNNDNIDTLVAYGLAQEGIEAMRNIRDSNWVLGLNFDGKKPGQENQNDSIWGEIFFDKNSPENVRKYFSIHRKDNNELQACSDQNVVDCAPWQLIALQNPDAQFSDQNGKLNLEAFPAGELEKLSVYKIQTSQDQSVAFESAGSLYNQFSNNTLTPSLAQTPFSRFLITEKLCFNKTQGPVCQTGDNENMKFRVYSIVLWKGINGLKKQVILTTELTDWRK
jgi:prepilin-type N-terminal cleavage/methylation domain-containing protein